jgi:regulator of protease activity HflC (stomatin/prohibitin superfamily)
MLQEKVYRGVSGWFMVAVLLVTTVAGFVITGHGIDAVQSAEPSASTQVIGGVALLAVSFFCWFGFRVINPNTALAIQLFGDYKGTIKTAGFWWLNPLTSRRRVSLRVRNFESGKLKVNDSIGNPIEIGAIVVWRVVDTAEALFLVDDYEHFVHMQTESAVRILATSFPYDSHDEGGISLQGSGTEVSQRLGHEIQERLNKAGVEVIEARISHLAYAPEIASAMLRRQQATAVIAARQKIVEGAVGMVEMALDLLNAKQVVTLDEERKATMVSNLLVVLCGDKDAQPVVNTGTLYQ